MSVKEIVDLLMYFNNFFLSLLGLMLSSVLMGASSNNIYSCWVLMELNMMVFIALLVFDPSGVNSLGMQYFVVQSLSSSLFLFSFFLGWLAPGAPLMALMGLSMILKIGAFPFHLWYIKLINKCHWLNFFFLSTTQKILPLFVISNIGGNALFLGSALAGALFSCIFSFSETSMKKILGFSSIFNMSWMIIALGDHQVFMFYTGCYSVSTGVVISFLNESYLWNKNFILSSNKSMLNKWAILLGMLSISGFPPLVGFWAKLSVVAYLNLMAQYFLVASMLSMSLIMMYIYLMVIIESLNNLLPLPINAGTGSSPMPPLLLLFSPAFMI